MSGEQQPRTEGAALGGGPAAEPADLEDLAARLDSIVVRASREAWRRGEELLDRLNREIGELSSRLARQAWERGQGDAQSEGDRRRTR